MMNVSRYQHRWRPEQDQYKNHVKQQRAANQRIRRKVSLQNNVKGRCGRDPMVVGFTTTYAISAPITSKIVSSNLDQGEGYNIMV
jgi:hypothetical protein